MTTTISKDGLTATAHLGDGMVLLAFDLDPGRTADLAGFAVRCTPKGGAGRYLLNRLDFAVGVSGATTPEKRPYTPSDQAPFQKFRWYHVPSDLPASGTGVYTYDVTAMYFAPGGGLKAGASVQLPVEFQPIGTPKMRLGFTRGYLTSQAYARKFGNEDIRPPGPKGLFATGPFEPQYEWLGYHARKLVLDFLAQASGDAETTLDVFAYDLDEPDIIDALAALGPRLRIILDNSILHVKPGAVEIVADQKLVASAGVANVHQGHFKRFSHDKVLIQKKRGQAVRVLTGSANFSIRGLYVQANNVIVIDDQQVASWYESAFQESFEDMAGFARSEAASRWFDRRSAELPDFSVCFSPHRDSVLSLGPISEAIGQAQSSVLFAVMELGGGGEVLSSLRDLAAQGHVFSYGITQSAKGLTVYKPGESKGVLADFAALDKHVPPPFDKEWRGGMGQVIHDKFVVVDFNGADPVVFTGSSNLASGGEEANGDNLLAIRDPEFATAFAVEAIRLTDHYHFRDAMENADPTDPLKLQGAAPGDEKRWWEDYYDERDLKAYERELFVRAAR